MTIQMPAMYALFAGSLLNVGLAAQGVQTNASAVAMDYNGKFQRLRRDVREPQDDIAEFVGAEKVLVRKKKKDASKKTTQVLEHQESGAGESSMPPTPAHKPTYGTSGAAVGGGGSFEAATLTVLAAGTDVTELIGFAQRHTSSCSMADVFGDNVTSYPKTFHDAKQIQLDYCKIHFEEGFCTTAIDLHFLKHAPQDGAEAFTLTPIFCKESVQLLGIDATYMEPEGASLLKDGGGSNSRLFRQQRLGFASGCFPNSATVSLRFEGGRVATHTMEHLRVGDSVLTQAGFSKIFAFMDHDSNTKGEYVQLATASGHELSLSADHLVFAHAEQSPVLANTIVEGDLLWIMKDATVLPSRVVGVGHSLQRGKHAPLTEHGTVVVNGVLSSSYTTVKSLRWGGQILLTGHVINKYMHEPLRLACSLWPTLCAAGWHSADGRHAWTQFILSNFGWLKDMNSMESDIQAAWTKPSVSTWLAILAQLMAAGALVTIFGSGSLLPLMALQVAVRRWRVFKKV